LAVLSFHYSPDFEIMEFQWVSNLKCSRKKTPKWDFTRTRVAKSDPEFLFEEIQWSIRDSHQSAAFKWKTEELQKCIKLLSRQKSDTFSLHKYLGE
jgi:hypothetical protein